ncbi:hypothetical protein ACNA06_17880 [Lysinibacillus sp. RSDA_15]|uniref:hypothetical protein n=1 Tax=Lysinibacillus sp. RSDA_15 TaxID=3391421 RepID=UPI003A4D62FF
MIRVELAKRIIEKLGYSSSIIHRAINAKELETVSDDRILSDYEYAITRDSFHDYLYRLGLSEREVNCIMEYI